MAWECSFEVKSYKVKFYTRHPKWANTTDLAPVIVLYDSPDATTLAWKAHVHFWDRLEEVPPASKNGNTLEMHFHSPWYDRILAVLQAGGKTECFYQRQPTQTWIELHGEARAIGTK